MTLGGSLALGLLGSNLKDLIIVALVAAVLLGISGSWWLLFGQRFEQPRVRLIMLALLVLSVASLVLVAWAIGGPLKEGFLKNPRLYIAVVSWGFLPLVPAVVAWRLLVVSLWKTSRFDSAMAWLLLGAIFVILGLAAAPAGSQLVAVLMLPAIIPWLAIWGLGLRLRWCPLGSKSRIPIMIAGIAWGALAGYLAFVTWLYKGFYGA